MPAFVADDGTSLHYEVSGTGDPVLLLHSLGFDGSLWQSVGVTEALIQAGRSVITPDIRGHGRSQRWHEPDRYGLDTMARDVASLIDLLELQSIDLAAYSIGSRIALRHLQLDRRTRRAVLAGIGGNARPRPASSLPPSEPAPTSVEADTYVRAHLPYLAGRVEAGQTDPQAIVALLRSPMSTTQPLDGVVADVLLLCGTRDDDPLPLAADLPHATVQLVEADHGSTMDHPAFAQAIVDFLARP